MYNQNGANLHLVRLLTEEALVKLADGVRLDSVITLVSEMPPVLRATRIQLSALSKPIAANNHSRENSKALA